MVEPAHARNVRVSPRRAASSAGYAYMERLHDVPSLRYEPVPRPDEYESPRATYEVEAADAVDIPVMVRVMAAATPSTRAMRRVAVMVYLRNKGGCVRPSSASP